MAPRGDFKGELAEGVGSDATHDSGLSDEAGGKYE